MTAFEEINQKAKQAILHTDFKGAIYLLETISSTKDKEVLTNLGVCYSKIDEYRKALHYLDLVLAIDSNDVYALSNKANIYHRNGNSDAAIEVYKQLIQNNPSNVEFINNLGIIYLDKGNHLEALECFNKVERFSGVSSQNLINKSNALLQFNRVNDAINALLLATKTSPDNYEAWNNLALAYARIGDNDIAIVAFNTAILKNQNYYSARYNLGKLYFEMKDYQGAKAAFEKALTIKETPEVYSELGDLYSELKDYEKSVFYFKKSIALQPPNVTSNYNLGNSYFDLKKYDLAIECYLNALAINPNHKNSLSNLGILYSIQKDNQKALQYFEKALSLEPANPSYLKNVKICRSKLSV